MAIPTGFNGSSAANVAYMPGMDSPHTGLSDTGEHAAHSSLQSGHVMCGRFEIRKQIGIGGMGAVYRAYDHNQGDDIAIKVMLPELASSDVAKQRFISEAKIAIKLAHQNIVNTFDVLSDGAYVFITMELLEGRSLREDIESRKRISRPYTETEALEIVRALCDALEYAHDFTVHRDIKPENIWLTTKDKVKLMDFGIARTLNGSQMGKSTAVLGTAYYMAPEQLAGSRGVDHRADQYALGVLLYELLTGQVPTGRSKSVRQQRKDVSAVVSDAIDRALEPDPEDRHPNIRAFANALGGIKQGASQTRQTNQTHRNGSGGLADWINEHRVVVGIGGLLWGGVLIGAYMVHQDSLKQNQTRWEKWQIEMNAAFDRAGKLKGDSDTRANAWGRYLAAYAKDNPFTTEDEKLRAQAENHKQEAEGEKKAQLEARAMAKQQQRDAAQRQMAQVPLVQQPMYPAPTAPQHMTQAQLAQQQMYQAQLAQQQMQQAQLAQQQMQQAQLAQQQKLRGQRSVEQEAGLMILDRMLRW